MIKIPIEHSDSYVLKNSGDSHGHIGQLIEDVDRILDYILGEVTESECSEFEEALSLSDSNAHYPYLNAVATISEISNILLPVTPPPFVKEKVMSKIRERTAQAYHSR